jgi:hypothetical protein
MPTKSNASVIYKLGVDIKENSHGGDIVCSAGQSVL